MSESKLRTALKQSLHVMEKGIEIRMHDNWPALKAVLPDAIRLAKEALAETEPEGEPIESSPRKAHAEMKKSCVSNCFIIPKDGQQSSMFDFVGQEGLCYVNLDGYAIIPIEQYRYLRSEKIEGVPDGWHVVRVAETKPGDWVINYDGEPYQCKDTLSGVQMIIERIYGFESKPTEPDGLPIETAPRESVLASALKKALHVMEKGIEVRMQDSWPVLQAILPDAIRSAKEALAECIPEPEGEPIETAPMDGTMILALMGGTWLEAYHDGDFFVTEAKHNLPYDWDQRNQPTRWKPIPKLTTHCPVCKLDMRGCTWCSDPKPGCPMPSKPPEPKYRPFANAAEFKPHCDKWIRFKAEAANPASYRIDSYDDRGVSRNNNFMFYGELAAECCWDDGTPCGVKVEG